MDSENLKILGSPIERYYSIKENLDRVGFMGTILDMILDKTRFGSGHRGLLTARLDKIDLTRLELVPTFFGFLTTGFLRGASLCAAGEGSGSPIDDRVLCF
jgi:hypothetical protein